MLFVSPIFIFLFLPAVLSLYYILSGCRRLQNTVLLLASLFFYAWGEPGFVMILIGSIICNWLLAILIDAHAAGRIKKVCLTAGIVINLGLLFVYKYLNFVISQVNRFGGVSIPVIEIALPVGISFFTFQAISYLTDVYRGEKSQKNLINAGLYIGFFPQLIAGPIVRYHTVKDQIPNRKESLYAFKYGVRRFILGFTKKVLLANTMAGIADKAFSLTGNDLTVSFAWLGAAAYTFQIYFDFSGYSDMAIGLGRMFGFTFHENFHEPYLACSVTEFWRRWHISLSTWFRDYVYIPLGGSRTDHASRHYFNLLIVWLLTGIWHGADWTYIVWGLLYFMILLIEKTTPYGSLIGKHRAAGHICTLFAVMMLWVVFRAESMNQALYYIRTMTGLTGAPLHSGRTWVYLRENCVFLIFAVLFSFVSSARAARLCSRFTGRDNKAQSAVSIAGEILLALLFLIAIVFLINGTYNPFIYFHF